MNISELSRSSRERLVAVEFHESGRAELFLRGADGRISSELQPFRPWLLTAGPELAGRLEGVREVVPLAGPGSLRCLARFDDRAACDRAAKQLKALTGLGPGSPLAPYRVFGDESQQLLTMLPARLFQGMTFSELRRLQLDIEVRSSVPGSFCNAGRPGDSIILVSLRDSTGWETCISARDIGEDGLLRETIRLVQERDPDVIEGHNIFNFDLPYIDARCRRLGIPLAIGRGGRPARCRPSRFSAGERTAGYTRYAVYGRHVVDTYHLVQLHDVSHRDLESYGLKAAAVHFGIASPERTYVDGGDITRLFDEDPETLKKYCLDDVRETDGLSRILSPSYFYQAQIIPFSYQNCVVRGNAARIDALLCASYLQAGGSLPTPQAPVDFRGALTTADLEGVFRHVWHIDVRSLYPSIIIADGLSPESDHLGVYSRMLEKLRLFRLEAKDAMRRSEGEEREHYRALQGTFKILINSFYGYAGFGQGTFNDYRMAAAVTGRGRAILTSMRDFLLSRNAQVIEMDTDGIYFTPPADVEDKEAMERMVQAILPKGIEVELDAEYQAMFSYRSKNYALLDPEGRITMTGAALKSRGLEPFQRRYIHDHISLLLHGRAGEVDGLYERYVRAIEDHAFPLRDFAKREILSTAPATYADKLAKGETRRSAAYELALKASRAYSQGDQVLFYVVGNRRNVPVTGNSRLLEENPDQQRDENIPYYLEKLKQLRAKFR